MAITRVAMSTDDDDDIVRKIEEKLNKFFQQPQDMKVVSFSSSLTTLSYRIIHS